MFRFDCRTSVAAVLLSAGLCPLHAQPNTAGAVAVAVASSANPAAFAAPLIFTVKVTSSAASGPVPGGTVTATLPGPYPLGTAVLDGSGRAVIAVPQPPGLLTVVPWGLGAGSNTITFSYSGDSNYAPSASKFTQWIDKANTATAAAIVGSSQPLKLTATVSINQPSVTTTAFSVPGNLTSSAPSGTVTFFNGTTLLGKAALTPSGLFTSTAFIGSAVTPANLVAVYSGDDNYNGSTSPGTAGTGGGAVTLNVTSSSNPSTFAETVTLRIAAAPAATNAPAPSGTVNASLLGLFNLGSVTLDANGQGSLDVPMNSILANPLAPWGLAAGADAITISCNGDARYAPTSTTITQIVTRASTVTEAVVAANADVFSVTATVSISEPSVTPIAFALPGSNAGPSPTGAIQFLYGNTVIGTAALSPSGHLQSSATLSITQALPASAPIVAVYNGDSNYTGSTSPPATQPNNGIATIGVASSDNPSTFAQPVKFTVTVAPAVPGGPIPTGSIRASVLGSDLLGTATLDSSGKASFSVPQGAGSQAALPWGFATGSNAITITYSGDSNYQPGTTTFTQLVNKADSFTELPLTPGAVGTVAAVVRINEPSVYGSPFAIPAGWNLSISPTGNVTFYNGPTALGTAALTPGSSFQSTAIFRTQLTRDSVRAIYDGDTNYNGSSSPATVGNAPVNVALASSTNPVVYGAAFTVLATVTSAAGGTTPTGTLSFYDGSLNLGWTATLDSGGRGSLQIPIPLATPLACAPLCLSAQVEVLAAGSHTITVSYSGDANYAPVPQSASLSVQINKAPSTTKLEEGATGVFPSTNFFLAATVTDAQPPGGGPYHFLIMTPSGLVNGNPSGTVQFFGGTTAIGTVALTPDPSANVTSHATLTTTNTSTTFSAAYSGDDNFQPSSGPTPLAVSVKLATSLNPSDVGQAVTLTASLVPSSAATAPAGSVDFFDDKTVLGRTTVASGVATLTVTFSTAGSHFLTANYNGDVNYLPASSAAYVQTVMPIGVTPGVLTLASSNPTPVFGEQIVFSVGVKGSGAAPPQGTVTLLDGTTPIGGGNWDLGSVQAVVTLPVGTHQISAVWAGDANWPPARSGVLQEVVNRASSATTLSSNLTITVSAVRPGAGTPTGTAQLVDTSNQLVLATVTLIGGSAKVTSISDPISNNAVLEAVYLGDTDFAPSTSSILPVIVNAVGARTAKLAPDEIATIYGANLTAPVTVIDGTGASRTALLYYTSSTQINFVVPEGTASGPATIGGQGVAAAQIVRVHPDSTQAIESVAALNQATGQFQPVPIAFGSDSLYLVLYGTGLRHASSLAAVTCSIGGMVLPVTYAGAQSQFAGLDQVVVPLTAALKGAGAVNVVVTADGQSSNTVSITFQ